MIFSDVNFPYLYSLFTLGLAILLLALSSVSKGKGGKVMRILCYAFFLWTVILWVDGCKTQERINAKLEEGG